MGRLGLVFLAVLLAGTAMEAEAQNWFDSVKNFFVTQLDTIQEKFTEFENVLGDTFNSLSEKVRNFFNNQSFSSATATDLLTELKGDTWKAMEPLMLMTMPKVEMDKLITAAAGRPDIPDRFVDELQRLVILNMTNQEVATSVKTKVPACTDDTEKLARVCELSSAEMSALLERLGPVESWTSDNITSFSSYTLRIPVCLDDSNNTTVLQNVIDLVNNCDVSSPPIGCPARSKLDAIRWPVTVKMLGSPGDWKLSAVKKTIPDVLEIPSFTIPYTSDSFINDMKSELVKARLPSPITPELEAWFAEICRVDGCSSMSVVATKTWYGGLGSLKSVVTPSDVTSEAGKDATLAVQLEANAKNRNPIRAVDAAALLDMKLTKTEPESITSIGGKLAVWAPACYLKEAADKKTLGSVRTDLSPRLDLVRGPEYMAKVRAALQADMEVAFTNNVFKINSVTDYLKPFVSAKFLSEQSSPTLLGVAQLAEKNYTPLDRYQMQMVVSKIAPADSQDCPKSLCENLPISFMAGFSTDYLTRIDDELTGVTLPCLLGVKRVFTDKSTLLPKDMAAGKAFLKCMSYEDALKVNSSYIFEVFKEIKNQELSWPACRALELQLRGWAINTFNLNPDANFKDTAQDVANRLYLNEIYAIPACVLIAYESVIYNMDMQVKKAVLNKLCSAENYLTIPRDTRSRFVNKLLAGTMGDLITLCGLRRINKCFIDLDTSMLKKMDEGATAEYLKNLETSLKRGLPVCLDSTQKDQVAKMVLQAKGDAGNWKTADDMACILDTLSSAGIDRIVADLPDEVFITTECPNRDNTFSNTVVEDNCMKATTDSREAMKKKKIERCVQLREKYGTSNNTCDSVMCGNVLDMTSSQLEAMTKQEVMSLLDGLVTDALDKEKATVVLAKVKEVKPLKDMSIEELQRLKYAWRGLSKQDVGNLPTFTSEYKEVIRQLGMTNGLPNDVMIALRNKILDEYKAPSNMDVMDVFLLGQVVCYLTEDQINAIPNAVIMKAMRTIGVLQCQNSTTTYYLAMKAKAAYGKEPKDWDAATVSESGFLASGLKPEDLASVPDKSFIGFLPTVFIKIDPNTLKVMTKSQAVNLNGATASAVTSAQEGSLDSDVLLAINNAKSENLRNAASGVFLPRVVSAVAATVLPLLLYASSRSWVSGVTLGGEGKLVL